MYTLRCTQRLLTRLKEAPLDEAGVTLMPSTTRLGDWYANLHLQHRRAWLLAVSAETLLPVLMPLAGKAPRHERFNAAVDEMMRICGVAPEVRARELAEMREPPVIARTADRSAVASLSQFAFDLRFAWEGDPALPPEALTSTLARSPTTRLKMDSADRRTRRLLGGQPARQRGVERALKTLGAGRFMTFIRAVRPLDDTLAVKLMAEALDEGQSLERLFYTGEQLGFTLDVTRLAGETFRIEFGCVAGPLAGDGSEWIVTFDEWNITGLEPGAFWMS
jgi:hypothetical protein